MDHMKNLPPAGGVFTYLMLADIRDNIAIKLEYNMARSWY